MTLKAVFFDLDGTLLDTAPDFVVTLNQLADEYQIPRLPSERIRERVSDGARAMTQLLFGISESEAGFEDRRQRLLDIYYQHMGKHCVLFDGMHELLENIIGENLLWGIITKKPVRFAQPIVNNLELPKAPDLLICPDHVKNTKPDPEPIIKTCRDLNIDSHQLIYIGDHKRDIDCGINAGCETIAVSFGYIHKNERIEDWQATHMVNHSREIWPIIQTRLTR